MNRHMERLEVYLHASQDDEVDMIDFVNAEADIIHDLAFERNIALNVISKLKGSTPQEVLDEIRQSAKIAREGIKDEH